MNLTNLKVQFFKITLERFPNLFRPSSNPYISGDSFRNFADHIFDESKTLDPRKIKKNDIVFLNPDMADIYFLYFHKNILHDYFLITHNSNIEPGDLIKKYNDEKILHWFALNLDINNSNATVIPMGLENLRRLRYGRKKWYKNLENIHKSKFVLASFDIFKNFDERAFVLDEIGKNQFVEHKIFKTKKEYFLNLKDYKFLICPKGEGYDTSRIWEGLLYNAYPILKLNKHTSILKDMGFPGIYLDNWRDLNQYSEKSLIDLYNKFLTNKNLEINFYDYWENKFKQLKNN